MFIVEKNTRLLVRICKMYYDEGKSQQKISEIVGISRPQVSRYLSTAREMGIVSILIGPFSREHQFEQAIAQKHQLLDVLVVDTQEDQINQQMADEITVLLGSAIKDNNIFGVMSGKSINTLSKKIGNINRENVTVVPLVGGMSARVDTQANVNALNFARMLNSRHYQFNAPAFVSSDAVADVLLNEPSVIEVMNLARASHVALVSIGHVQGYVSSTVDVEEAVRNGAVANLCGSFLDANGAPILYPGMSRMIGLSLDELRNIPKVIAIAIGTNRVDAIKSVLRGKWVDILITNLQTAQKLMESD